MADFNFQSLMNDPQFQLGLAMMAGGAKGGGGLAGALGYYQNMQQAQQQAMMNALRMKQFQREEDKQKKMDDAIEGIRSKIHQFQKPAVPGALEQGMIGPGIKIDSQQGQMLADQMDGGSIADLIAANQAANYVQQGTAQEMPLQGSPASFDREGFKQATLNDRIMLDPKSAFADLYGGEEEAYTLAEGAKRFKGGKLIAENPKLDPDQYEVRPFAENGGWQDWVIDKRTKTKLRKEGDWYRKGKDAAEVTAVANAGEKGLSEFWKETAGARAKRLAEGEKAAEAAADNLASLNRFLAESKKGTAGGAQPVITGVQNLLSSFGFSSAELTSTITMSQAIAANKAAYMKQLGARGLTDQDMKILGEALPKVDTSRTAREEVARILIKSNKATIDRWYKDHQATYRNAPPGMEFLREPPAWYQDYSTQTPPPPPGFKENK